MSQHKRTVIWNLINFLGAAITFFGITQLGWPAWLVFAIPVFAGPPLSILFEHLTGGGVRPVRNPRGH